MQKWNIDRILGDKLSEIVAEFVSKPSKVHNISYIILGYVLASYAISVDPNLSDYVLKIVLVGGIIAAFLFYVQPIEKLLWGYALWRTHSRSNIGIFPFNSLFLTETIGKIVGGFFFAIACWIMAYNPNLEKYLIENPFWRYGMIAASIPVLLIALYETWTRLPQKIRIVSFYYNLLRIYQGGGPRSLPSAKESKDSLTSLKIALESGDWIEASHIVSGLSERSNTKNGFVISGK